MTWIRTERYNFGAPVMWKWTDNVTGEWQIRVEGDPPSNAAVVPDTDDDHVTVGELNEHDTDIKALAPLCAHVLL